MPSDSETAGRGVRKDTAPGTDPGWGAGATTAAPPSPALDRAEPARPFGGYVGRFRLIELLGEGGMGAVWLAEQSAPVARQVALKLMRSVLVSSTARARFEGERQALARLSHPAIAQMYEAGTAEGVPWFAMELVSGEPVTTWCDARRATIRERIELLVAICRGVQFAHQKGIVHRDLKPSNLLVSEVDGRALPKIIDFGIAKAIDEPLSDATMLGSSQLLGTPGYVSPESWNATGGAVDVDTRSDVYSLGVVLFELLVGLPPFDLATLGLATAVQRVSSSDPPAPTRRLRDADEATRRTLAAARRLEPAAHLGALAGDLDAIAGRAMARDRERRYDSASALAADLERHLAHQPIAARPPSAWLTVKKFARRHRAAVTVAALSGAALVAALAGALLESARARRSEARTAAVAKFLIDTLGAANPWSSSADLTVREMLDRAVPRLEHELAADPSVRADLLETISSTYYHLRELERAEATGRQALDLRVALYGADSAQAAASMNDLALTLPPEKRAEAEALLRRTIEIRRKLRGDSHPSVARGYLDLAGIVRDPAERERLLRASVAIREHGDTPDQLAFSLRGLGEFLVWSGRTGEAEPVLERALALAHEGELSEERARYYMGELRQRQGRYAEAEREYLRSLEVSEKVRGARSVKLGEILLCLGQIAMAEGRLDGATARFAQALDIFRHPAARSAEHEALALTELARLDRLRSDPVSAEARLRTALEIWRGYPAEETGRATTEWELGALLAERGDLAGAETLLCGGLEPWRALHPAGSPELLAAERACAGVHEATARRGS